HGDGIELIATNTPVEKLDAPRCGVERPFAVALHNRYRGRPVLLANQKNGVRGVLRIYVDGLLLVRLCRERSGALAVGRVVAGQHDIVLSGTEQPAERGGVEPGRGVHEGVGGLLGSVEAFSALCLMDRS